MPSSPPTARIILTSRLLLGDPITDDSLLALYQNLHDKVHARSGQSAPLRLVYIRTEHEAVLAWVSLHPPLLSIFHLAYLLTALQ